MKTYIRRGIYVIILLVIIAAVVFYYSKQGIIKVKITRVKKGAIEKTITGVSSGTVEPLRRVKLQALLPLKIKKVNFKEGDRVKEGDVIIKLDDAELTIKLELQKAALTTAELRLHELEDQFNLSRQNHERTRKLYEGGAVPDSRFDEVKSQFSAAEKAFAIAKNAITEAKLSIRLTEEELEKTNIRAPFNGRISFLDATIGELPSYAGTEGGLISSQQNISAAQGLKPFCEVIDDSVIKVKVPFDEVDATKIRLGQTTRIVSDTAPDKIFRGKVIFISPVVSKTLEQNRTVDVEIAVNKDDKAHLPVGASVDGEIILHTQTDVLLIPTNTIVEKETKKFVYSIGKNIVRKIDIKAGISNWDSTQILEGLKEGEPVITSLDMEGIEDGKKVMIEEGK
ncbi:MAG: efflux RND transporter periplasmic adaptor subunit [Nitrospirae bacterium]|nr:efflux RND transporter periplasmic adaptor subunit [Nitrospirota bacterium]